MKRLVRNSRVKDFGIFVRRSALFFLVLAITFSLFEPGISKVLAESNANKTFNPNYQLAPLPSEKPADKRTITAGGVGGKLLGAVANRTGGVYIARQGARAYVGQSGNIGKRMTQHVAGQKLSPYAAKNSWRIPVVSSQRVRMTYESLIYKALGGKRMPWVANKQVPLKISKWRFR